ncbi:hypothetical protein BSKO_07061 [Bryopsis sp. KO-2023]|nr:hypothetical protein BSKO_07061 [Bryopsis sp. KO-2023]
MRSRNNDAKRAFLPVHSDTKSDHKTDCGEMSKHQFPPHLDPGAPRRVVHVDSQGRPSLITVGKHTLVAQLGIPYRDLRILDPWVPIPYPMSIFIRERALVVNLENVRMVICKDQVYILGVRHQDGSDEIIHEPNLELPFVHDLCEMLGNPDYEVERHARSSDARLAIDWDLPYELRAFESALSEGVRVLDEQVDNLESTAFPALELLASKVSAKQLEDIREIKHSMNRLLLKVNKLKKELEKLLDDDMDMMDMYLGKRAEREEYMMDSDQQREDLQSTPTGYGAENSDRHHHSSIQQSLSRFGDHHGLGSISGSSDEGDSARSDSMPVNKKKLSSKRSFSSSQLDKLEVSERFRPQHSESTVARDDHSTAASSATEEPAVVANGALYKMLSSRLLGGTTTSSKKKTMVGWDLIRTHADKGTPREFQTLTRTITHVNPREVEGIEALLEAYFMQVEFTLSRLLQLKEHIDDTEDLINIDLDHRRNELHALEVLVTSITLMFAFVSMVAGVFGMNLRTGLENELNAFVWVTIVSVIVAVTLFVGLLYYVRSRRLMFIPNNSTVRQVMVPNVHTLRKSTTLPL